MGARRGGETDQQNVIMHKVYYSSLLKFGIQVFNKVIIVVDVVVVIIIIIIIIIIQRQFIQ